MQFFCYCFFGYIRWGKKWSVSHHGQPQYVLLWSFSLVLQDVQTFICMYCEIMRIKGWLGMMIDRFITQGFPGQLTRIPKCLDSPYVSLMSNEVRWQHDLTLKEDNGGSFAMADNQITCCQSCLCKIHHSHYKTLKVYVCHITMSNHTCMRVNIR